MLNNQLDLVDSFREDGYVIVRDVIDEELLRDARRHVAWLLERDTLGRPELLSTPPVEPDPFWHRLVSDERLLDIAEAFIGPNIGLFAASYFNKLPGNGLPVLWHQDGNLWPLDPQDGVISLWLAIDDSDMENGCLRVIPGSHKLKFQEVQPRTDVVNALSVAIDESVVDESRAIPIELRAGDVSIHHSATIHGSDANTSSRPRRGLTIRYIPTTTRITPNQSRDAYAGDWPDRWPCSFLLRGNAQPTINDWVPPPKYVASEHMPFRGAERYT